MSNHVDWGGFNQEYRYALWRIWGDEANFVQFVGLNPSTADENLDDPTIRRCVQFAKDWGFEALCMTNLFAFRATDPKNMKATEAPVGPQNDVWLKEVSREAGTVIACWGAQGDFLGRDLEVSTLIPEMKCLKLTQGGHPRHPLYLKKDLIPIDYVHTSLRNSEGT
jgi:hypothetical protein